MLNCSPYERDHFEENDAVYLEFFSGDILPGSTTHFIDNASLFLTKNAFSCNWLSLKCLLEEMRLKPFVRNESIQRIFKIRLKSRSFSWQKRKRNPLRQGLLRSRIYVYLPLRDMYSMNQDVSWTHFKDSLETEPRHISNVGFWLMHIIRVWEWWGSRVLTCKMKYC